MNQKTVVVALMVGGGLLLLIGGATAVTHKRTSPNPNITRWDEYIYLVSSQTGVPKAIIAAIMEIESSGRKDVKGTSGEFGLMQIKCDTARQVGFTGECKDLFVAYTNIFWGAKYLQWQWKRYNGNLSQVFSAYNAGTATDANPLYVRKVRSAYQRYMEYY